jgi:hypothetical protein
MLTEPKIDPPIAKKSTVKKTKKTVEKLDLLPLMDEIKSLFGHTPLFSTVPDYTTALEKVIHAPPKWGPNRIKKFFTELEIVKFSRTKPSGFSLDQQKWTEIRRKMVAGEDILAALAIQEIQKKEQAALNIDLVQIPSKHTPIEQIHPKVQVKPDISVKTKSQVKVEPVQKTSKISTPSLKVEPRPVTIADTESILNRYNTFPRFLLNRVSKDAQRAMSLGILEIERADIGKLESILEHLHNARLFFDPAYSNEKDILDFLDIKCKRVSKRLDQLQEEYNQREIQKRIIEPLDKGKFDRIINNWGSKYSVEEAAYQILEKLGRDVRKISLSEFAFRKLIVEYLQKKYPNKPK